VRLSVLTYQCDNCGLCCLSMLARATIVDAMREPRIATECRRAKVNGVVEDWYMLNLDPENGEMMPCRYHTGTGCGIYNTRPNTCVGFQAGSPDCQSLRHGAGLAPLEPSYVDREEDYISFDSAPEFQGNGAIDGSKTQG
jgi:Fe-S-cluster containining protein